MEYSLTPRPQQRFLEVMSLNPYSNGILSDNFDSVQFAFPDTCLNPYSNGILSDNL